MSAVTRSQQFISPLHCGDSFVMQSGQLRPLEKGPISALERSGKRAKKKSLRFPSDDCEFFSNIWNVQTHDGREPKKFIDIAQVAYIITAIDFKSGYEGGEQVDDTMNIWSEELIVPRSDGSSTKVEVNALSRRSEIVVCESSTENKPDSSEHRARTKTLQKLLSIHGSTSFHSIPVAPPSKLEGTKAVFSSVLTQPELLDNWSSRFLLSLHEPIRHALYVIDRFLERSRTKLSPLEWNTSAFFAWFTQYFAEYVKIQQKLKSTVLRPLVQIKYASKHEIVDCYEEIAFVIDAISLQEKMLAVSATSGVHSWKQSMVSLQADIRKLNVLLHHVLNIEERVFQPAIDATFSEDTFHKFVMPRILSAVRPKRVMIPWIIERSRVWGGEEEAATIKRQLPFAARFLYDRVWYPHFVRNVAAAMKTLDVTMTDMPVEVAGESWLGCVVQ